MFHVSILNVGRRKKLDSLYQSDIRQGIRRLTCYIQTKQSAHKTQHADVPIRPDITSQLKFYSYIRIASQNIGETGELCSGIGKRPLSGIIAQIQAPSLEFVRKFFQILYCDT